MNVDSENMISEENVDFHCNTLGEASTENVDFHCNTLGEASTENTAKGNYSNISTQQQVKTTISPDLSDVTHRKEKEKKQKEKEQRSQGRRCYCEESCKIWGISKGGRWWKGWSTNWRWYFV